MAAKNYIKVALVTLLTIALVICAVPMAFAAEVDASDIVDTTADTTVTVESGAAADSVDSADSATPADSGDDVVAPGTEEVADESKETAKDEAADTEADSTEATTGGADKGDSADKKGGISTGTIISIVIVAVIVIACAVYCIINRAKVAKFFREVRSECKKIVWTPFKTVRKNLLIVLIIMVLCAVVIGALDLLFSKGIIALGDLI